MKIANKANIQKYIVSRYYSDGKAITNKIIEIINMNTSKFLEEFEEILLKNSITIYPYDTTIGFYKLLIINKILKLYGIETYHHYHYINSGDIYNTTLIFDFEKIKFYVGCIGDEMEKNICYTKHSLKWE